MKPDGVSIIICAYNAEQRLAPTLEALQRQVFSKEIIQWELILVDNASTDRTADKAKEIWNKNPVAPLRYIQENRPGLMNAKNRGLQEAHYDIVSFIDDDNWVEPLWIEKVYEVFCQHAEVGACGGRSEAVFEQSPPAWFATYQNSFAVGRQAEQTGYADLAKGFLWGAGFSMRRSLWEKLHQRGFKNLAMGREGENINAGEDAELSYAIRLLGWRLYYRDDLVLKHYMPAGRMHFPYLEKMSAGFGKAFARLNCYRVLLYPGQFKLHPWWYEWIVARKNIFLARGKIRMTRNQETRENLGIKIAYNKGYASQVWKDKSVNRWVNELKKIFFDAEQLRRKGND